MGKEIDLLREYPKSKRDITKRLVEKDKKFEQSLENLGRNFLMGSENMDTADSIIIPNIGSQ